MNIRRLNSLIKEVATLAAIVVLLSACGQQNPETLIKSAKGFIAKRDYAAATIQLKNIIQKQENGEARYLLAVSYIELGNYGAAELQLRQALAAKFSTEAIYPALAKVMLGLGDFNKLTSELGSVTVSDPTAQASIKSALGNAYLSLGQLKAARQAFLDALSSAPGDLSAKVGQARVSAAEGDTPTASKAIDEILANSPAFVPALSLRADLLIAQARHEEAITVLTNLVNIAPYNAQARFALVSLFIAADKFDQATASIAAMKKLLPRDVRSTYLEALLAFRQNKPAAARDAVVQVLNVIPDHTPSLLLAGAAEYQLGSLSTAGDYLRRVLAKNPDNLYARNLLVTTYLRQGQPGKAEEALAPALQKAPNNPTILRTAGEVAFASNKLTDAATYYEQALKLETENTQLRTRLAQIRLAKGETELAIDELEATSSLGKGDYQADLSLIATYLNRKDYDKALAAAAALEKKLPDSALAYNVKGTVYIARRDLKNARLNFENALTVQPDYLPAARVLASLDISENNPASAKHRFEAILARQPDNEGALLSLAQVQISVKAGAKEITETIERAIKSNPASVPARLDLINFLTDNRNSGAALTAAQMANAAIPNEPRILDALGLAQMNSGNTSQAIETFNKLANAMPGSPLPQLRLATAGFAAKQIDAPILALRKALVIKPDLLEAQRGIIAMQLAAGRPDEALKETKFIQKARPTEAVGYTLEGDVFASQKKLVEAASSYAEGIKRQPAPELVVRQLQLLHAAGKVTEANSVTARWLKEYPKDPVVPFHLANTAMHDKEYPLAVKQYKNVLKLLPDNPVVMNNLALTLGELKDPAAISYAEQAYAKAPTNPAIQDTYGWMLFHNGETKRAVDLLAKAAQGEPTSVEIRMHLAKALLKSGDKANAKKELEALVQADSQAAERAEAAQLLKEL